MDCSVFGVTLLAQWQTHDCLTVTQVTLKDMAKINRCLTVKILPQRYGQGSRFAMLRCSLALFEFSHSLQGYLTGIVDIIGFSSIKKTWWAVDISIVNFRMVLLPDQAIANNGLLILFYLALHLSDLPDVIMRLKSPAPIVYSAVYSGANLGNIKAPRHRPLWAEITGDRWIPHTLGEFIKSVFCISSQTI